jgi:magnesium-transporting ATPase (P-type)
MGPSEDKISLNADYVLLRGMSLRNTEYIYGIVVFTGHDAKVMRNSTSSKYKFSRLELLTNQSIYIIFIIQCVLALIAAIIGANFLFDVNTSDMKIPGCTDPDQHCQYAYYL